MELDLLDSKILNELGKDSRKTSSQIGKKIGTSQQVVSYRIKNLISKGIIEGFFTEINFGHFGLSNYQAMIKLKTISKVRKKEMIGKLSKGENVLLLSECGGKWDLIIDIIEENSTKFQKRFLKLIQNFEEDILDYDLFATMGGAEFNEEKFSNSKEILKSKYFGEEEKSNFSRTDLLILKEISKNGRYNIIELEEKLKINHKTIIKKIKEMIDKKIIRGFKPDIDSNKLEEYRSKILIDFDKLNKKDIDDLTKFLSTKKNVLGTLKMIGKWNFSIGLKTKSQGEMWEFYREIQSYIGNKVRSIELVPIFKKYEYNYFPESLLD